MELQKLTQEQALEIIDWRYPFPYDYYNFSPDHREQDLRYLVNPENVFWAILSATKELEGYCSFGCDGQVPGGNYSAEALDIGMGIRPDLTGRGNGKLYAQAILDHAAHHYAATRMRVTVAVFNRRAQRLWQKIGFEQIERFVKRGSQDEFVMMGFCVENRARAIS